MRSAPTKKEIQSSLLDPSQLHFADPSAYNDIYNPGARWDKDKTMYRSFGEDHSSFGFLTYAEAKQRKDVLQPFFSRRAIINMQSLVRQNVGLNSRHQVGRLTNARSTTSPRFSHAITKSACLRICSLRCDVSRWTRSQHSALHNRSTRWMPLTSPLLS
jgi:hypothetical protein